jgi:serine/threonine-protein kinase
VKAQGVALEVQIIVQVLVQMAYVGTFILARSSRRGTLRAMDQLIAAQREVRAREAAFQEVRQDLDRALEVGGAGHYTGKQMGRFVLGSLIGRGAMGEVYEARGDRGVAIKVLHPHVLAKQSSVKRFLREARAAATMRSRHAVRIIEASSPDDAVPHIVMERLHGKDLAQRLRVERRLPMADLVELVAQVGSVLDEARELGIVHRDVKPQNLYQAEEGFAKVWKLLDFGASKLAEHSGTLTAGRVVGTPSYMSPEQARGEDVNFRADLYSLAAITYRCLTGQPPFTGKDLPTTLFQVVYGTPSQPSVIADVDPAFDLVLAVGMAKDPAARFASGREFAEAVEAALRGELSPELRDRSERLLRDYPWGMHPRPASE